MQSVILLIFVLIVNPLVFQEIWTRLMEGIIPPTYSSRFVIKTPSFLSMTDADSFRYHIPWRMQRYSVIQDYFFKNLTRCQTVAECKSTCITSLDRTGCCPCSIWDWKTTRRLGDFLLCPNLNRLRLQKQCHFQRPSPLLQWLWSSMPIFHCQQIAN